MSSRARSVDLAAVREDLRTSTDPRATRTRARIAHAAIDLCASQKPVTVSSLTATAGVSRAVFYTHFTDLSDLAHRMAADTFAEIGFTAESEFLSDPEAAMKHAIGDLVAHIWANRALYRAVLTLPAEGNSQIQQGAFMEESIRHLLISTGALPSHLRLELVTRYLTAGVIGLTTPWVLGELEATETELGEHLFALLPSWLRGAGH
ncbi:MAG: TetR/AcrR family transcriptional regulator [Beutenbergiaceae bacterium]